MRALFFLDVQLSVLARRRRYSKLDGHVESWY